MASISYDPYLEHKITINIPPRGANISSTKEQIALQGEKSQGFFHGTTEQECTSPTYIKFPPSRNRWARGANNYVRYSAMSLI